MQRRGQYFDSRKRSKIRNFQHEYYSSDIQIVLIGNEGLHQNYEYQERRLHHEGVKLPNEGLYILRIPISNIVLSQVFCNVPVCIHVLVIEKPNVDAELYQLSYESTGGGYFLPVGSIRQINATDDFVFDQNVDLKNRQSSAHVMTSSLVAVFN